MQYKQHPLSAAFPAMAEDDYQSLRDSIAEIGVQNPITLYEGMVIDGWHRYRAANELCMDCPAVELGDVDPRYFVLAQNKARRHVTQAQLAMATTAVYAWQPVGNPSYKSTAYQLGTECPITKTAAELAAISGVGERTIKQAKVVQTKATPEVVEAVKRGEIGLPKAAKIANLPKDEQVAAIRKPAPKPAQPQPEDVPVNAPSEDEISYILAQQDADQKAIEAILEGNGDIAPLKKEYDRMAHELATVKAQRDEYMNKCNELIRRVKYLRGQLDKQPKAA